MTNEPLVRTEEKGLRTESTPKASFLSPQSFVLLILLLAWWLGAHGLNAAMLWWDEFLSIKTVGGAHYGVLTPGEVWHKLATENPWQTPLYFLLLNRWGTLVGWTPFALRALSLLCGVLTIAVVYRLGREVLSRRVGVYAAAALGGSAFFVGYLHELRAYSLVALLAALSVWLYWKMVNAPLTPAPLPQGARGKTRIFDTRGMIGLRVGFVLALAALMYTHYAGVIVAAALGVVHVVRLFWRADEASKSGRAVARPYNPVIVGTPYRASVEGLNSPPTRSMWHWWRGTVAILLAGVLFLPWASVMVSVGGAIAGNEGRQLLTLDTWGTLGLLAYGLSNGIVPLVAVAVISLIKSPPQPLSIAMGRGNGEGIQWGLPFIWLTTLAVLILTLALNAVLPFIAHIRYVMGIVPLWAVLFGAGIEGIAGAVAESRTTQALSLRNTESVGTMPASSARRIEYLVGARRASPLRRSVALLLVLGWLALGVYQSITPTFDDVLFRPEMLTFFRPHLPLNRLADDLARRALPGDAVALESPLHPWAIAGAFDVYTHPLPVRAVMLDQLPGDENGYAAQARAFIGDSLRVWLAVEHNAPPTFRFTTFEQTLTGMGYTRCPDQTLTYDGLSAELFTRSAGCCCPPEADAPIVAQFGAGVRLTHVDSLPESVGDSLDVMTAWAVDSSVPLETYSVALHVLDADGAMVTQADFGLPAPPFACRATTLPLDGVPPGNYTLVALVYAWQSGERLPVGDGDHIEIGTFEIP